MGQTCSGIVLVTALGHARLALITVVNAAAREAARAVVLAFPPVLVLCGVGRLADAVGSLAAVCPAERIGVVDLGGRCRAFVQELCRDLRGWTSRWRR